MEASSDADESPEAFLDAGSESSFLNGRHLVPLLIFRDARCQVQSNKKTLILPSSLLFCFDLIASGRSVAPEDRGELTGGLAEAGLDRPFMKFRNWTETPVPGVSPWLFRPCHPCSRFPMVNRGCTALLSSLRGQAEGLPTALTQA
jgi:hypothetical protein